MSQLQPVKITDAEFSEIKMLQRKFEETTFKLGLLQVEKMELDQRVNDFVEKEKQLKEEWFSIKKLDQSLHDKIVETYGVGGLNMANGTFTPAEPSNSPITK